MYYLISIQFAALSNYRQFHPFIFHVKHTALISSGIQD
jgi:hypothetical protein